MSRRDTYTGGGTILRVGRDGLEWTSSDQAGSTMAQKPLKRWDKERAPTQKEIERQSREDDIAEAKLIRSFISQCAAAYAAGKLEASWPEPPKSLKARVKSSGGNVAWLSAQATYQGLFHKAYCRLIGKEIAFEQVWSHAKSKSRLCVRSLLRGSWTRLTDHRSSAFKLISHCSIANF